MLHFLFNSILCNSACNWWELLVVSFYTLHHNGPWWTWICSTTVSCPTWHLAGRGCLDKYRGQRLFEQLMRDEFSKTVSAARNASLSGWKRVLVWTAKMRFGPSAGSWVSWCMYICCFSFSNIVFSQGICGYFPYSWRWSFVIDLCHIQKPKNLWHQCLLQLHPRRVLLAFSHSNGETLVAKTLSKGCLRLQCLCWDFQCWLWGIGKYSIVSQVLNSIHISQTGLFFQIPPPFMKWKLFFCNFFFWRS